MKRYEELGREYGRVVVRRFAVDGNGRAVNPCPLGKRYILRDRDCWDCTLFEGCEYRLERQAEQEESRRSPGRK